MSTSDRYPSVPAFDRLERLLLWAARADRNVLPACTHLTRMSLVSLGASLLLASLLMFLALVMAVDTILLPDSLPLRWPLGALLAAMPALGYLFLNRWLLDYAGVYGHSRSMLTLLVALMALGFALAVLPTLEIRLLGNATAAATTDAVAAQEQTSHRRYTSARSMARALGIPLKDNFDTRRERLQRIRAEMGTSFALTEAVLFLALAALAAMPHLLKSSLEDSEYRCLLEAKRRFDQQLQLSDGR